MNKFKDYAAYGLTQIVGKAEFRIYKNRNDWWIMCIPCGLGDINSVNWQGQRLQVRTDKGNIFIFSDFNTWEWIN
jgi:hypothetical protein